MRSAVRLQACSTVVWLRLPNARPIAGSVASVSSRVRYMATWRGQATGCGAAGGERARPSRCRRPRRSLLDLLDRAAARAQLGIEAGEDLLGELGGDRPAGERAEGDDADQRALERADVGVDALGDQLERARRRRRRRRPGARACAGSSGACRGRAARTSHTRPASKRSRSRSSSASMSRGRRSEVSTSWAPAACSALNVWKNSCSVLALLWRNWTSSTSRTSTPR